LVATKAHRPQPVVDDVRADLAPRTLHQLLHLLQVGVDEPGPARASEWVETRIPQVHVALHRLGVAAHQLGGRPGAASQVVRGEYLHDLRRGFGQDLFSEVAGVAMFQLPHSQVRAWVDSNNEGLLSIHLEFSCPSARSALSAYLESDVSVVTRSSLRWNASPFREFTVRDPAAHIDMHRRIHVLLAIRHLDPPQDDAATVYGLAVRQG